MRCGNQTTNWYCKNRAKDDGMTLVVKKHDTAK